MRNPTPHDKLLDKIRQRGATIGVVGVGYIGLPTAALFSSKGFSVLGLDTDRAKTDALNRGECFIDEPGLPDLVRTGVENGRLRGSIDPSELHSSDVLIFCTQTPLKPDSSTDLDFLFSAIHSALEHAKEPVLAICESTVPVGTVSEIAKMFTETGRYEIDVNLWVAHCPERVLPGKLLDELRTNNRIVGGVTAKSAELAGALYEAFVPGDKIVRCSSAESEFAKLAENTYRDVNIALANEFAKIADVLNVDVTRVIAIANMHPRVNIHSPGIGVGGHCLPKDPVLLCNSVKQAGLLPRLIPAARAINEEMPIYVLGRLSSLLPSGSFNGLRVLVLGTSFKENVSDTRNSPSQRIIGELIDRGAKVQAHDPHNRERFGASNAESVTEAIKWADVIILAAPHREYAEAIPRADLTRKVFVDGRNTYSAAQLRCKEYLGVGRFPDRNEKTRPTPRARQSQIVQRAPVKEP